MTVKRLIDRDSLRLSQGLLQASPFCNIDCKYCYLPDRSSTNRMSLETLKHSLRFLVAEKPGLLDPGASLIFHCGEPLSVPIDFYISAFDMIEEMNPRDTPISLRFTTNGMRINQTWCDQIKARGYVKICVSIDGPQWLHDTNRVTRQGRGTYTEVIRGINLLRDNGIPFDVLCVLTRQSLEVPEELWQFFCELGAQKVGFCVEEILGEHKNSSLQFQAAYERMTNFFEVWLQLRDTERPGLYVRELDELLDTLPKRAMFGEPLMRRDNIPFSIVTISWKGDICLFSPELLNMKTLRYRDFVFGNVATHSIDDILASSKLETVYREILSGIVKCKSSCRYFDDCGGGFPVAKLLEHGTFFASETLTCRMRVQAIMDVVKRRLQAGSPLSDGNTLIHLAELN